VEGLRRVVDGEVELHYHKVVAVRKAPGCRARHRPGGQGDGALDHMGRLVDVARSGPPRRSTLSGVAVSATVSCSIAAQGLAGRDTSRPGLGHRTEGPVTCRSPGPSVRRGVPVEAQQQSGLEAQAGRDQLLPDRRPGG
jgi:hypothetical protein